MRSTDPKYAVLRSLLLLDDVSRRRLRALASSVDEIDVPEGTTLIEEGKLNRHAYVIVSGSLSVQHDGTRVARVGPGEIVGERSALTHDPANATVIADAPASALVFEHRVLLGLTADVPTLGSRLHRLVDNRDAPTLAA